MASGTLADPVKDVSSAPRQNAATVNVAGEAAWAEPSVLYIQAAAVDGTSTINFTTWAGQVIANYPIYQQGKFDLALIKSVDGSSGVTAIWRHY